MIGARDGEACGLLRQGLALLDAQREAMIGGKLDELARINAELADWISRMPRPAAAARETIGHADATRLLGTLRGAEAWGAAAALSSGAHEATSLRVG